MRNIAALCIFCSLIWGCKSTQNHYTVAVEQEYLPFSYVEDGQLTGFDVDIALAICAELKAECKFVTVPFDSVFEMLEEGTVTFAVMGFSRTPEREKIMLFSDGYYRSSSIFLSRENLATATPDTLKGKTIAVKQSTVQEEYLLTHYPESIILPQQNYSDLFEAMRNDGTDMAFLESLAAYSYLMDEQNKGLNIINSVKLDDMLCIAFNLNEGKLRDRVNKALVKLKQTGEFYSISRRYFEINIL